MDQYDFIIAGSGAAGLSLAYYLSLSPILKNKKVLLLDKDLKQQNDRTWGFWTREPGPFDEIISYSFPNVEFISPEFSALLPLGPYQYQVLEGIRFYAFIKERLSLFSNFHFRQEAIESMESLENSAKIRTNKNTYQASWIFNSCFSEKETKLAAGDKLYLRQHFKGWVIKTTRPAFDTRNMRLFDFRTPENGLMSFFYMIPHSPQQALVEYTLFSSSLLEPHAYVQALKDYIQNILQLQDYEIVDQEWGVIPMTTYPFPQKKGERIIQTGSAGGATKPSTGYTFLRIQDQCRKIVHQLEKGEAPHPLTSGKDRFRLYDEMLLNIIDKRGDESKKIFSQLFRKNPVERILKFLDEESNFKEEFLIMNSVPPFKFIKSFFNVKFGTPLTRKT